MNNNHGNPILRFPYRVLAGAITTCVLAASANQGFAEGVSDQFQFELEEITVTATKIGTTDLQSTPIAITAISSEALERAVAKDIRDIAHITPGLTISENTGSAQVIIRGIGTNNVNTGSDPSSTIHVDGVYFARPSSGFNNFIDVERVEVLRGPQGTLYGRNSVGGTVNIVSKSPSLDETRVKLQLTSGNEDLFRSDVLVSGPLIKDKIAASLAAQYSNHGPFRENVAETGNDVDEDDSLSFRAQLYTSLSNNWDATLRADHYKQKSAIYGYHTFVEPSPIAPIAQSINGDYRKVALDFPQHQDKEMWGVSLDVEGELSESWSIKSITAYRNSNTDIAIDADASELDIIRSYAIENQDQVSQEFNLIHRFDRGSTLFGFYYFEEYAKAPSVVEIRQAGIMRSPIPEVNTSAWALFGQLNYSLTEKLSITTGIRYTEEEKEFTKNDKISVIDSGILIADLSFPEETGKYRKTTPKLGLEYQYSPNLLVYGSASRGFKSGGFNMIAVEPGGYDEELLWAYEAGIKSDWIDNRLRFNATAFYYDYDDLQVQAFVAPGQTDVSNAATASLEGLELEISGMPKPYLEISLNASYLDATYDDYVDAPIAGGESIDASGNRLNNAPEWSYSLAAEYHKDLGKGSIYARADYSWQDEVFFTADNNRIDHQQSYGLLNASLGYVSADQRTEVSLWGRNLADEEYVTGTAQFTLVSAARAGFPRTFGIRISYEY